MASAFELVAHDAEAAESLDEAEKLAQTNPYIASIRVYEITTQ